MSDLLSLDPVASDDERGVPKPEPQRPVVANPSTPGVQKPPNRPGGREAPPAHEKRADASELEEQARQAIREAETTDAAIEEGRAILRRASRRLLYEHLVPATPANKRRWLVAFKAQRLEARRAPRMRESAPRRVARRRPPVRRGARSGSLGDPPGEPSPLSRPSAQERAA